MRDDCKIDLEMMYQIQEAIDAFGEDVSVTYPNPVGNNLNK